jgi:hypothetical protein
MVGKKRTLRMLSVNKFYCLDRGDVWKYVLFTHWGGGTAFRTFTFAEMLEKPHRIHSVERVTDNGRGLIYVRLTALEGDHEFWFDPAVNHLVRKATRVPEGARDLRFESEVTKFTEAAPGVFFPTEVEHRRHKDSQLTGVVRTTISDLKVNQSLPTDTLRIPNIAGMTCTDADRRTDFTVDADGNRVGPETPAEFATGVPHSSSSTPFQALAPSQPPWPLWLWVLIASCFCLALAGGLWYVRHRRSES